MAGILINGRRYSYTSLEISVVKPDGASEIFIDITEISYSEALTIEFVRGTNQKPIGWTAGTYEAADATLSLAKSSFQQLVDGIGNGWLGSNVQVVVKYSDVEEPLTTDKLVARIAGAEDSHSFGAETLMTSLTLKVFEIERNGVKGVASA